MIDNDSLKSPFAILENEQLSSVIFVQNYLQLDFDGNRLTCFRWPIVVVKGLFYSFDEPGFRDKLCEVISRKVTQTLFTEHIVLKIYFDDDSQIQLDLKIGPNEKIHEVGTFTDINKNWSFF